MTMTDPIADMLARLRNANSAYHEKVSMPSSSVKARIAEILKQEGYISGYYIESNQTGFGNTLVLDLKFGSNRERSILDFWREQKIFEASTTARQNGEPWTFYETEDGTSGTQTLACTSDGNCELVDISA